MACHDGGPHAYGSRVVGRYVEKRNPMTRTHRHPVTGTSIQTLGTTVSSYNSSVVEVLL